MLAGGLVGLAAALLAGEMFEVSALIGTWGTINGLVAGVLTFLGVMGTGQGWFAVAGRWLLVLALAVVCWWLVFFAAGASPISLEGAWMWPLAAVALAGLGVAVRWARRGSGRP